LDCWNGRNKFHPSGQYLLFEGHCPWKQHLNTIEAQFDMRGLIKFVFFKDERGMYRIQTVSESGFSNRVSILKKYQGLRGHELNKAAGIPDGEFVHAAGFIGGAWSLESCIQLADHSLQAQKNNNPESRDDGFQVVGQNNR
jgi:uncharacterized UPF0160 family protein